MSAAAADPEPATEPGLLSKLGDKLVPDVVRHRQNLHVSLERAVDNSAQPTVHESSLSQSYHWLKDLFDDETLDKLFKHEHAGNYVRIRGTNEQIFESMPLYVRIGMHLLFYGSYQIRFLHMNRVRTLLREQTLKQGRIYDSTDPAIVQPHIESFIKTYSVNLKELAKPDPKSYATINEFFSRRLKPGARPIASPADPSVIVSAADCRITVFKTVDSAKHVWIKDRAFSVANLLGNAKLAEQFGPAPALAIFRLAPADYHRYHNPVGGTLGALSSIAGEYYTVNPTAVNEDLNVFTGNRRDVLMLDATLGPGAPTVPVAFVAIGAMLVGAIGWDAKSGDAVKKGDPLGWFQYGGSTCVVVFPTGSVEWDADLLSTSSTGLETLVRVGEQIGKAVVPPAAA